MTTITLKAPAKINFTLDVLGKRPDGYHELSSVMQSVSLYDTLTIRKTEGEAVKLTVRDEAGRPLTEADGMPLDKRNLTVKAALRLSEYAGKPLGCEIELTKAIPSAAGMAGGSTDAAAVLIGLNKLYELDLSEETLSEIAARIGADVPFCVAGGTCLCEGIGEILTRLPSLGGIDLVLVKPNVDVPTKEIFTKLDALSEVSHPDTKKLVKWATEKENFTDFTQLCGMIGNTLEDVTIPLHPVISELKDALLKNGAKGALMSGSGPTVFGVFASENEAFEASRTMREKYPEFVVKIAKTTNFGIEEIAE